MQNLLTLSSELIVVVLFVMFVWGSFSYLTSGGNPERLKKARSTIMYAIIGVIIFVSSFLILKTIDVLFLGNCGRIFHFSLDTQNDTPDCPP